MMGKTHRQLGAMVAMSWFLYLKSVGGLDPGISNVAELVTMYGASYYGAVFPDVDQVGEASPVSDPLSILINKTIHLTSPIRRRMRDMKKDKGFIYKVLGLLDARHRSWQTHSEVPLLLLWLATTFIRGGLVGVMVLGFALGYLSHVVGDLLSVGGWNILSFKVMNKVLKREILPEKIRLVPKTKFFVTDGAFEHGAFRVAVVVNYVLALVIVGWAVRDLYLMLF